MYRLFLINKILKQLQSCSGSDPAHYNSGLNSGPKVKLGRVGNSFKVTLPADMIQDLGWKEGDVLRVGLDDNNITIHKDKQK